MSISSMCKILYEVNSAPEEDIAEVAPASSHIKGEQNGQSKH